MYLKGGMGIFCLFSIVQSSIEIAESVESFISNNQIELKCEDEAYDIILSTLQLIFSSVQFLFIFLNGNVYFKNYIKFLSFFF
jgi:hypothetical protein